MFAQQSESFAARLDKIRTNMQQKARTGARRAIHGKRLTLFPRIRGACVVGLFRHG
jgi:hypothetical protein